MVLIVSALVVGLALTRRPVVASVVAAVTLSSWLGSIPLAPLPPGRLDAAGVMSTDVIEGEYGPYALIELAGGTILADLPPGSAARRGDLVRLEGLAAGDPGTARGVRHRGVVEVDSFERLAGPGSPILALGNAVRDRVSTRLVPAEGGRALLAGFLVGDTDGVDEVDEEAMRRAGLSHFTAVSGSNVALFLTVLFVAVGPLGVGPKRRAVIGLLGLPVFAAATRFEPSVLRASAMAGIGLTGRLMDVGLEVWQVLSAAVIGLMIVDPALAGNVGFQLSTAAAAGVLIGARWPIHSGKIGRALAVAIGAQAAVAPLLVLHFGEVPVMSPLVNLIAAPLVALATLLGVIGVIGPVLVADVGAGLAGVVLFMAHVAAGWPQVGWVGLLVALAALTLLLVLPRWRSQLALAAASAVLVLISGAGASLPDPGVVVLDVGQGDSILIAGGEGRVALVDGGPDPVLLVEKLRSYQVRSLELVVLTHVHADHATGLSGLVGRVPIGQVWADLEPHHTPASEELTAALGEAGIPVGPPEIGTVWQLGALSIRVEAPLRRYASPNDQSIVLTVGGPGRTMLLSGDIEQVAQAELAHLRADVLKVPHQGAATSDPVWLTEVGAELAVISVGPNDFGHPADWVVKLLEESGAEVLRTDRDHDVVVPLS
jgi:competence protein ComEC